MFRDELIDRLLDYVDEATKNKYSPHTVKFDINRLIDEYIYSKEEEYKEGVAYTLNDALHGKISAKDAEGELLDCYLWATEVN